MRNFLSLFITIIVSASAFSQSAVDVVHYKFLVDLNDDNDKIFGLAVVTLTSTDNLPAVELDLVAQQEKGMKVSEVSFADKRPGKPAFTQKNNKLTIATPVKKGDTLTLLINYSGIPADGLIISKNKYGHRTFFADNWPNRGHNWLPCHDDPADKASVEFVVTAPQHYQVVANGLQTEETNLPDNKKRTHWKEEVPVSTKVMVIGVADFAVNLSGFVNNCIPVYSWVYPEDRDKGFYDYAQAAEILPWFIKNAGPYGYKKLANVESKTIFGGLENANTIFYSESSITGNRKSEGLLTHEIAHQWFGNMATEKTFAHLWLSEGFATYMTILYMEQKYGSDTARKMRLEDREQVIGFAKQSNKSVVDHTTDYMELLNPNSYQKGGWVLHMLRRELGDSAFWKAIRSYYATYAGKTADTDDFRKIIEKISGKDMKPFFQQWLYSPGIPDLKISWKYQATDKKVAVTVEQKQAAAFRFPLTVQLSSDRSTSDQQIQVSKAKETFYLPAKTAVTGLKADPGADLLFNSTVVNER
jgi:aminopeptidase N